MTNRGSPDDPILLALQERAKELSCLYAVEEVLGQSDRPNDDLFRSVVEVLPPGWQFPEVCGARLLLAGKEYATPSHRETPWKLEEPVRVEGDVVGALEVVYLEQRPVADDGPFLKEERRLLRAIAERVGDHLTQQRLRRLHPGMEDALAGLATRDFQWSVVLDFLRRTNQELVRRITRKMINHLCWSGVQEAEGLLAEVVAERQAPTDDNRPARKAAPVDLTSLVDRTFSIAARHLAAAEMTSSLQGWIEEEKAGFLVDAVENPASGLAEITGALERFTSEGVQESRLPRGLRQSLRVSLLRRFFTDRLGYLNVAKAFVEVSDFCDLARHTVFPIWSHGKLGGKSAGLFLAARVVASSPEHAGALRNVQVPKTWYVSSDGVLAFVQHNRLEDLYDRKYLDTERIRQDYPHVIQLFKSSAFPPELRRGLAAALDDFEDRPLIVRSSSLLEDQAGASFSGKYKSLFLANQGSKRERLAALEDAIAEVYASIFGPDPIEYRAERGLLDFHEEMAVMIQEVVGKRVGRYFFPAFAGVIFSNNEFRWSRRIRREDGLVRMVPGLGTRAVDRVSDDYPILFSPGQPGLRVNVTADEVARYSPRMMDVMNLETNTFETVRVEGLLRECGEEYPAVRQLISLLGPDGLRSPSYLEPDWERDDFVVTCQGLLSTGPFVGQVRTLVSLLQEKLGMPVDLEFASDGRDLHLLQCRVQSGSQQDLPAPIPRNIAPDRLLFHARRYITNGRIPELSHVVYVVPEGYAALEKLERLQEVGRAVGRLNQLLPRHLFMLIGPGRWGSRGDIKLGVSVTYSDINNAAVLAEVARKRGHYEPELSFGTHFFQDLVEAEIRYLPLYPEDPGAVFNDDFFLRSGNMLAELLPEYAHLADILRVIDVRRETGGLVLHVLLNSDLDEAVGMLAPPSPGPAVAPRPEAAPELPPEEHWTWRLRIAECIAAHVDPERFGVRGIYLVGSTKNATAGPQSDIDLLVHVGGTARQREELLLWLEGWNHALAELNYLRTGYRLDPFLDVEIITDEDLSRKAPSTARIGAVADAARPLPLGTARTGGDGSA